MKSFRDASAKLHGIFNAVSQKDVLLFGSLFQSCLMLSRKFQWPFMEVSRNFHDILNVV